METLTKPKITAQELRIGNWVLLDTKTTLPMPHRVMPKDIWDIAEGRITIHALEPIPLTSEILEKAGVLNNNEYFSNPKLWPTYLTAGSNWFFVRTMSGDKVTTIGNVHQLQNLYFALTGEELDVSL